MPWGGPWVGNHGAGLFAAGRLAICVLRGLRDHGQASHIHVIQIAVVPLDSEIRPLAGVRPFYTNIKPQHPDRIEKSAFQVNGLDLENLMLYAPESERVADLLVEYIDRLRLPFGKVLVPLVQNWAF